MNRAAALSAFLLAIGIGGSGPQARAAEPSFEHLEQSLTCQCGCGLTVHACNHLQCPSAIPLRQEIREQIRLGKSEEEILDYFAGKYGEKILSAPTTRGFNLTAWITPFLIVSFGAVLIAATLVRWRRASGRRKEARESALPTAPPARPEIEAILERELEELDR